MKKLICRPFLYKKWGRIGTLAVSLAFLIILFHTPPLKLSDRLESYGKKEESKEKKLPYVNPDLLKIEHDKAVNEIKMRIEQNDAWFRSKFVLAGGLIAFLIGYLAQSEKTQKESSGESADPQTQQERSGGSADPQKSSKKPEGSEGELGEKAIGKLLNSNATCLVLALAYLLAVNIDIHTRINLSTTKQLGLWIANYVEPAFLYAAKEEEPSTSKPSSVKNQSSVTSTSKTSSVKNQSSVKDQFLPWEQFLRIEKDECEKSSNNLGKECLRGVGMHTDEFYAISNFQYGYFLTWLLYLSYLAVLQQVCYRRTKRELTEQQRAIMWGSFLAVHLAMLAFVLIAHIAPSAFEFIILSRQVRGNQLWWRFLIPWFFLLVASIPYLFKPSSKSDPQIQGQENTQKPEQLPPNS